MGRCAYCYSVITKQDDSCYICGDRVPKHTKVRAVKRQPVSALTNLVFMASLAFTAYCFFAERKLSLPMTLAISSALLLIRILAERFVNKGLD
jgi:hypothetical protein